MPKSFNPKARDKHAANAKEAVKLDQKAPDGLTEGLIETFPASDPVSAVSPVDHKNGSRRKATTPRKAKD